MKEAAHLPDPYHSNVWPIGIVGPEPLTSNSPACRHDLPRTQEIDRVTITLLPRQPGPRIKVWTALRAPSHGASQCRTTPIRLSRAIRARLGDPRDFPRDLQNWDRL